MVRPLTVDDVLPLDRYLEVRAAVQAGARAARAARRVTVGDRISLAFENRETVLFQIEEMVRVEEIRDPAKLAEEVRVYNDLIPGDDELRATFFVEITERARIRADLDSLIGLEAGGLFLVVDGEPVAAEFEPGHAREDRISAVHFVRFGLRPEQSGRIRDRRAELAVLVDHPGYRARAELGESTRRALAEDLGGGADATPTS